MKVTLAKISFLLVMLTGISACKKDKCKDVSCPSGLECSQGGCVCPNGYQGTNCDTLSYPKFVGQYLVTDGCSNFAQYFVNVYYAADTLAPGELLVDYLFQQAPPAQIYIINLPGDLGTNFTIPQQTAGTGSLAVTYTGTGQAVLNAQTNTVINIELNLSYTMVSTGETFTCTETLTKH